MFEFKKAYLKQNELSGKEVTILKTKKQGRSKILHEEIMKKTIQTIKALHLKGTPISYNVINAIAIAKGIVVENYRIMLVEHRGHLKFTNIWARNVLNKIQQSEEKW